MNARESYNGIREQVCNEWKWRRLRNAIYASWPYNQGLKTVARWDLSYHEWQDTRVYWLWSDELAMGRMKIIWSNGRVDICWKDDQPFFNARDEHLVEAILLGYVV